MQCSAVHTLLELIPRPFDYILESLWSDLYVMFSSLQQTFLKMASRFVRTSWTFTLISHLLSATFVARCSSVSSAKDWNANVRTTAIFNLFRCPFAEHARRQWLGNDFVNDSLSFSLSLVVCGLSFHKRCVYKIPNNCSYTRSRRSSSSLTPSLLPLPSSTLPRSSSDSISCSDESIVTSVIRVRSWSSWRYKFLIGY